MQRERYFSSDGWTALNCSVIALIIGLVASCTVGPDYVRPAAETPAAYKEAEGWKTAQPADGLNRGAWWEVFGDSRLNELEERVSVSNQSIAQAEAQFRQARALVQSARAGYYPTVTAGASASRSRKSVNTGSAVSSGTNDDFLMPLEASWEPDLWGRVRRSVESAEAAAQASAADLGAAHLSMQAELALDYFQLRSIDAQRQLLEETTEAYKKSLDMTRNRYASGVASQADVLQAETQLKSTQAQAVDIGVQRAQLEHAIATLSGRPASTFSIDVIPLPETITPPVIPAGVPSELLERRPDIASAERRMAAANAQIGVAEAAYYPAVTLSGAIGLESSQLSKLLSWPSRLWSVGTALSERVFDGGLRRAQGEQAKAAYDATVAAYRQTVLGAFQEVEDNLSALRILKEEAKLQEEAVVAALRSLAFTTNQYKAGTASYLDVIAVQSIALNNERTAVGIQGRGMAAAVGLIKALGGGWRRQELAAAVGK